MQLPLFNLPPPEQHALGSYESWRGRTSPLATNAIPQLTEAFLKLLAGMK